MKNECLIDGQIGMFDLPVIDVIKTKEISIENEENIKSDKLYSIVKLYSESCSRIVKTLSGALLVEFDDKTLYFNSAGINEFELTKDVAIMPGEEIIIANSDKEINEMQKEKLEALKVTEYIKRKGDANLIIPGEKTMVINPKGWVLEYDQKPIYHQNEIFNIGVSIEIQTIENRNTDVAVNMNEIEFKVNDDVNIEYEGIKSIGKVVRIYKNGETLNIKWEGKQTAFYYKNVSKVR
ncbi:hypothetical protein [Clostridium saccharoperbutylacetonicum]|uniref:hypothetical protein n=1 Tax=Clostridium saccharoperbutylacetonicum TaxID=36745 RepID=UPI000983C415|nr:hypothetical protein [Clostridium saccharoperbutylacetonicum]AQR96130.1 hypothetical protein CLSAP_34490 [Clostridium saccharoperbutylacetonicum]NSB32000.1 Lhr-like helicase [Clostridium saccharoperbutylacetonicum]